MSATSRSHKRCGLSGRKLEKDPPNVYEMVNTNSSRGEVDAPVNGLCEDMVGVTWKKFVV